MRRFRKWLIRAVVAFAVLLLLALGLYAARKPLFEQVVIKRLASAVAGQLGGSVSIEGLGGNWLTGIELHGITVRDGKLVREVVAGHATLDIGFWQLWQGHETDLRQLHLNADRVLLELDSSQLESDWNTASWHTPTVNTVRDLAANALLGGFTLHVADLEVRGQNDSVLRGQAHLEAAPRTAGDPMQATLTAPDLTLQIRGETNGTLHLAISTKAAERVAQLFANVPKNSSGSVELQLEIDNKEPVIAFTCSASNASWQGQSIATFESNGTLVSQDLEVKHAALQMGSTTATLDNYRANLGDPLAGTGTASLSANSIRPLLDRLPLQLAQLDSWRQIAPALDTLTGTLNLELRDHVLHLTPSKLLGGAADVQIVSGALPLRATQRTSTRIEFATEIRAADPKGEVPAAWRDLPAHPVAGQIKVLCTHRDDAFHLQLDADLSVRDQAGQTGTLAGRITMPLDGSLRIEPKLLLTGPLLRGLPPTTVSGVITAGSTDETTTLNLAPLLLSVADTGVFELRGDVVVGSDGAAGSDWRKALLASAVAVEMRDVAVAPLLAPMAQLVAPAKIPEWLKQLSGATVNGSVQTGKRSSATIQATWPQLPVLGATVASLNVEASESGVVFRDCDLQTSLGNAQVNATMPALTLRALLANPDLPMTTAVHATASVHSRPLQELVLAGPTAKLRGTLDIEAEMSGSFADPGLTMHLRDSDVELLVDDHRWHRPTGTVLYAGGAYRFRDAGFSIAAAVARFSGELQQVEGTLHGQINGTLVNLPVDVPDTELTAKFTANASHLTLDQLALQNAAAQVEGSNLTLAGGMAMVSDAIAAGDLNRILTSSLDGSLQITVPDLSLLPASWRQQRIAGQATATLVLAGTLLEPAPTLTLLIKGGSVRFPEGPRLDEIDAQITASSHRVACEQLSATVSGGSVQAAGTFVGKEPLWRAWQQAELGLTITGKDVLLRRRNGIKVRSDLDLTATGRLAQIELTGKLETQASKVVQRLPYFTLGQIGGPEASRGLALAGPDLGEHIGVSLNLAVTSLRPIEIATNVLAGKVTSALTIRGTLREPRIEGTLAMPTGTITFPGCTFRTSNALLQFDRNDSSFPSLSLSAAGRRHGYDVRMIVRGPYNAPEVQLSSTPPLPPEQLAVLVTTGARPDTLRGSRAVGVLLGSYLVQQLADQLFGSESTEAKEGFVSRFEVETGTEISANGTESIVVNFRVIDNVYLQGERDVYEDMNLGIVYRIRFQ